LVFSRAQCRCGPHTMCVRVLSIFGVRVCVCACICKYVCVCLGMFC
jgi:hypothetical protein